jgi:hypothetical protein
MKHFTNKELKQIIDFRSGNGSCSWSVWCREFGSDKVDFHFTGQDIQQLSDYMKTRSYKDLCKLQNSMEAEVRQYVIDNDFYRADHFEKYC